MHHKTLVDSLPSATISLCDDLGAKRCTRQDGNLDNKIMALASFSGRRNTRDGYATHLRVVAPLSKEERKLLAKSLVASYLMGLYRKGVADAILRRAINMLFTNWSGLHRSSLGTFGEW